MIIQKAVKLAMEVFEQKMEDFAGKADAGRKSYCPLMILRRMKTIP